MRKTGQRWTIKDKHNANALMEWLELQVSSGETPTLQVMKGDRSLDQNAMINTLYGDIARQADDLSVLDVRRQCKLHYGIGILKAADPEFAAWYDANIKPMTYEAKLMLMTHLDVTSKFSKAQASEYLDTIIREYTSQGFALARS